MSQITYITPRLAIVHCLQEAASMLKNNHGQYFYLFNLSTEEDNKVEALLPKRNVKAKNRGFPFSYKTTLQLCMQLDRYFHKGISNTAAFYSPHNEFGMCVIICYMYVSGRFKQIISAINYFKTKYHSTIPQRWLLNFEEFYDNMNIVMPPIKILKKVTLISNPEVVPIFNVSRQSRFQQLNQVYSHPIQDQLQEHYYHVLSGGHHSKKPRSDYVFKPIVIAGDFRIDLYSYQSLKQTKMMSIGFNTLFIDTDTMSFEGSDLYQNTRDNNAQVILQFDDYCQCKSEMLLSKRCNHCLEELKMVKKQYNQLIDLSSQFNRNRKKDVSVKLIFGNQKFDDVNQ